MTTQEFTEKANLVHNNKYDYSLVEYVNNKTKIKIICPIHGEFEQIPKNHLDGHGCPNCSPNARKSKSDFIKEANLVHNNKYDYSLVEYKNKRSKIKIICPIHGEFEQIADNHLQGHGCPKCAIDFKAAKKARTRQQFLEKANSVHGNYYDYSLVSSFSNSSKIKIICPTHGVFEQMVFSHLEGHGCPICRESKGEKIIRNYLVENHIDFVPQKRFKNCKDKLPLPFDFYIPSKNLLIEFDGRQHYEAIEAFGGQEALETVKLHDSIKTDFASRNGFDLLRIKFDENIYNELGSIFGALNG